MSLKFFLKLYSRLIGLTFLVLLLCILLFSAINSVREQAWQERFAQPLMRWLAVAPDPGHQYHWLGSLYDYQAHPPGQLELPATIRERLGYGQVVAMETSLGDQLLVRGGNGRILGLRFHDLYRDVTEAVALVSLQHLNRVRASEQEAFMVRLSGAFSVWLRPLDEASALPPEAVLERVSERGIAFYRQPGGAANVLLRLQDGTLVRLQMPPDFSPWGWPVIVLMLAVGGAVLALALFLGLRGMDRNLRALESVAVRIARGELGARVSTDDNRQVARLAEAFNSMAEHIQRLVGVQREMIHAVSHELRTPVARIRFGIQMLEDCPDAEALQKQLDGIDDDIQELDELIDEILTYARLEQGGPVFSLREADVINIVRQVVAEQQRLHPQLSISADIDEDSEHWRLADVEPRYIHRAIQNLVGNAARYASARIRVQCRLDQDNCRVDVEDDGAGIPEQDWGKVFTAFARLDDSRTRTSGGYGLGLSIVQRILYWHGGQAFVSRSDSFGGACFSLVWPRRKLADAVV